MSNEQKPKLRLEIAHVLFIDIVGYSKLLIDEQTEALQELNSVVRSAAAVTEAEAANALLRLPTGDGVALVFTQSAEAPVECAMQVSEAARSKLELPLRMGIHSGPVNHVEDLGGRENIAGAGINTAQRVMDCGDAGHILLSKRAADDLGQYRQWQPLLHDLGECEVKHGVRLHLVNLHGEGIGNSAIPGKVACATPASLPVARSMPTWPWVAAGGVILIGALVFLLLPRFAQRATRKEVTSTSRDALAKSIAVLPFENLSDDKQNAFFADGVQDEILTQLAKVADLKVISRTSVMQYRNAAARNLREVAQQLGVAHVLEGSVQRAVNRVRINAQLIDARTDAHVWAQSYDRDLADVFAIQSEIAQTIAEQLRAKLSSSEKVAIASPLTTDLAANDLYQRGLQLATNSNDPGGKSTLLQAITLLEEAVRHDSKFLRAYCQMCETHLDIYWGGFDHTDARREQARVALERAETISPDDGDVHLQKGMYAYHGFRDYDRALAQLELARAKLPNSTKAYMLTGAVERRLGRWDDAVRNFDRAVELDPRNFISVEEAGFTRAALGRFDEAKSFLERAIAIDPTDPLAPAQLAYLPYAKSADVKSWRAGLNEIEQRGRAAHVATLFVDCALAERDHSAADRALALVPPEGAVNPYDNSLIPRAYLIGLVARAFGDGTTAQRAFTEARGEVEKAIKMDPNYAPSWSLLGKSEAGLNHAAEAIAAGRRACELLPVAVDAADGPARIVDLAVIYAWVGQNDLAIDTLKRAAAAAGGSITYGDARLSPVWDSLRKDPRFDQIIAALAPK